MSSFSKCADGASAAAMVVGVAVGRFPPEIPEFGNNKDDTDKRNRHLLASSSEDAEDLVDQEGGDDNNNEEDNDEDDDDDEEETQQSQSLLTFSQSQKLLEPHFEDSQAAVQHLLSLHRHSPSEQGEAIIVISNSNQPIKSNNADEADETDRLQPQFETTTKRSQNETEDSISGETDPPPRVSDGRDEAVATSSPEHQRQNQQEEQTLTDEEENVGSQPTVTLHGDPSSSHRPKEIAHTPPHHHRPKEIAHTARPEGTAKDDTNDLPASAPPFCANDDEEGCAPPTTSAHLKDPQHVLDAVKKREDEEEESDDDEHEDFGHSQNTVNTAVLLEALELSGALEDSQQQEQEEMPPPVAKSAFSQQQNENNSSKNSLSETILFSNIKHCESYSPKNLLSETTLPINIKQDEEEPVDHDAEEHDDVDKTHPEDNHDRGSTDGSHNNNEEDAALKEMERSGDMTQVVGSQSILSQEIAFNFSQPPLLAPDDDDDDDSKDAEEANRQEDTPKQIKEEEEQDGPTTPVTTHTTKEKRTPASTARKYGLLLPKEEEREVRVKQENQVLLKNESPQNLPIVKEESNSSRENSPSCIQEEEDEATAGGEPLSQQLDLVGFSQEFRGLSQESTLLKGLSQESTLLKGLSQESTFLDSQQQLIGVIGEVISVPPSVTPATSASHSQESTYTTGAPATEPPPSRKRPAPQGLFGSLGLECLLQAADQVSARDEDIKVDSVRQSSRRTKRKAGATPEPPEPKKKKPAPVVKSTSTAASTTTTRKKGATPKTPPRKKAPSSFLPKRDAAAPASEPKEIKNKKTASAASPEPKETKNKKRPATLNTVPAPGASLTTGGTTYQRPDHELAQEAADLAVRVSNDDQMSKQLLLSMVMERQPTRTPPSSLPGRGHEMPPSFVWSHYPPLEKLLREHMEEYYHLSLQKRQSAAQQSFNNELVQIVRKVALDDWGWTIHSLDDKSLRDRIRCYYKTHIQNAKKRLATMLKNPRKVANARHLVRHLDLIKQTLETPQPLLLVPSDKPKSSEDDEDEDDEDDDIESYSQDES